MSEGENKQFVNFMMLLKTVSHRVRQFQVPQAPPTACLKLHMGN